MQRKIAFLIAFIIVSSSMTFALSEGVGAPPTGVDNTLVVNKETIELASFIASLTTVIALAIAVFQLHASNKQHKENSRREAAHQAINIAKCYQKEIIHDMGFVVCVFRLIKQTDKYEKEQRLHVDGLRFSREEFLEIFGPEAEFEYEEIQEKIDNKILAQAAIMADKISAPVGYASGDETERALRTVVDEINTWNAFEEIRLTLINKLEWIAMMINSKVADDAVIYQSLHQTFLKYVRSEYPRIARQNSDDIARDQFYTNIMLLYNNWQKKYLAALKKDEANKRHGTRQEERVQKMKQLRREKNIGYAPKI